MQSPVEQDLYADRWAPFIRTLVFLGHNWTGATFAGAVRLYFDAPSALVTLATVTTASAEGVRLIYGGSDTIANHITAGRLSEVPSGFASTDTILLSEVGIRINETSMEDPLKVPFPAERGGDVSLAWDLHVTPSGGNKDVFARGAFIVRPGATQ